jgi:RNA polymerase sigma-70 factor (ECF subfamily)
MPASLHTTWVGERLLRLRAGDPAARRDLAEFAAARLEKLAHAMLRNQFARVGRWVDTGDVVQNAVLRLWKALAEVVPESPLHFHRLAARYVRLELIDLSRHYFGPHGVGANHESGTPVGPAAPADPPARDADPSERAATADLHAAVQGLPEDELAVTDLLFYQGLTQEEAADLLGVDVRTVQRRWQRARRKLGELFAAGE